MTNETMRPEGADDMERELPEAAMDAIRRGYHDPPPTPRDEMWSVIATAVRNPDDVTEPDPGDASIPIDSRRSRRIPGGVTPWIGGLLAASVALLMGVGIGRMTAPAGSETGVQSGAVPPSSTRSGAVQTAAAGHLLDTEDLLRMVRVEARGGTRIDASMAARSRSLLTRTRLLLDSGDALTPQTRRLMEDLELVLVQVVLIAEGGLPEARYQGEVDILEEDLEQQNLFPRIQAAVPDPGIIYSAG